MGKETGTVYGISLGPGDPELITVKALTLLKSVDFIYYPGTIGVDGAISSVALDILQPYAFSETRLRVMPVPMSRSREPAESSYAGSYNLIAAECREGKSVAVVSVGDAGFYSTCSAILERADKDGISTLMVPGVPAFIAAGSAAGMPLALQNDKVLVLAQLDDITHLDRCLNEYETVVIMKLSTIKNELVSYLEKRAETFVYAERVGMSGEYITMDIEALRNRRIPYFSLLICSRHSEKSKLYRNNS
jgi:precorrin-2/cobalt-factor-2 C20-methyltransferase